MPVRSDMVMETLATSLSPYVDLHAVRGKGGDLLALLSANTRHQIRRAIRLYEAVGKLSIDRATTVQEGCAWLKALERLHQASWISRGKSGAFARPFFGRFLQQLFVRGFEEGVVDILRICAGRYELGYLYNFVYRDRVSNYQSGFRFGPDGRYKPGLLAHVLAVQHYASADLGLGKYSFLAGTSQYKTSLSTGSETLHWYAYRRRSRLMKLERAIASAATRLGL